MAVSSTAHTALKATMHQAKRARISDRHGCCDASPVTARILERDDAPNCLYAVVHVGEATSAVARSCMLRCEADAVIGDAETRESIGGQELDSQVTSMGMLCGVLDRL